MLFKKKKTESKPERKLRILVAEDDVSSRELMQIFLKECGEIHVAVNGAEAIKTVEKSFEDKAPFQLICLDIMMPEIDGLDALKKIRELEQENGVDKNSEAKVLMTTTVSQMSKTMKAFHYGCSGYLVKPISREKLIREINKLPLRREYDLQWRGR